MFVCSDALFGYVAIIEWYEGGAAYTLEIKNIDHLMGLIQSQIKTQQNNYPSTRVVSLSGV